LTIICLSDNILSLMSTVETGQLEALFAEVSSLAIRLRGGLAPAGREEGLTGGVSGVLQALAVDGPHTVPGVARARRTSRQNIQVVVNRLKKAGLVEIENNPAHQRSCLVRLTEEGKVALGQIKKAESERFESLLSQIPEEDVACTKRVLSLLRQLLGRQGGNETGQEVANLQQALPTRKERGNYRRQRLPTTPVVKDSTSDEEVFPVNLL